MLKTLLIPILALSFSVHLHAQTAAPTPPDGTCADVTFTPHPGETVPPLPHLTPSGHPVKIEVHFTTTYDGKSSKTGYKSELLTQRQQQDVCEAATRFGAVWSSTEFRDKVLEHGTFILGSKFWRFGHRPIEADVLFAALTANPLIVMHISGSDPGNPVKNCALSPGSGQQTLLREEYLSPSPNASSIVDCGPPLLVVALTNTLSHEYTHYAGATGQLGTKDDRSYDSGLDAANNLRYVSYGIGCITQMLAFPKANYPLSKCSDRTQK